MSEFIMMPVPVEKFTAVCALLGGVFSIDVDTVGKSPSAASAPSPTPATNTEAPATSTVASPSEQATVESKIDADGWPFDPALHTGSLTKAGLWRMKAGVSRPAPKPGYPVEGNSNASPAEQSEPVSVSGESTSADGAADTSASTATDEDDEFAAFRAAAAKSDAEDAAAKASVPVRNWTDADLGALCNQAATKLGDPSPIKEIIAKFIPEGTVAHSRNIPEDQRDAFAKAIEERAGIEFAG